MLVASVVLAVPISVASAAIGSPAVTHVSVASSRVWTATGITVRAGDSLDVHATGLVHFGNPPINRIAPSGIPWGQSCTALASGRVNGWPAHGFACWSLIGRIGTAPPFEIGDAKTFRVARDGELFLGVNDNYLADNAGTWPATISLTAAPTTTVPAPTTAAAPPTPTPATHGSRSLPVAGIAAAIAAVVALLGLVVLLRRRRRAAAARRSTVTGPAALELPPIVPVTAPAEVVADMLPQPRAPAEPGPTGLAAEGDLRDVNIFEVEFTDPATLRVGYNHFPEGTVLRWRVRHGDATAATGEVVTEGGGNTNHFVTISVGDIMAGANADGADVEFTWSVGGVPFGYWVRRALGA